MYRNIYDSRDTVQTEIRTPLQILKPDFLKIVNNPISILLFGYIKILYVQLVVSYGCETWTLTQKSEEILPVFGRRLPKRTYGSIKEDGASRIRHNEELIQLHRDRHIVRFVKTKMFQ